MKFTALIAAAAAININKDDLPANASLVEKLDPVSRYVNDDDLVQIKNTQLLQLSKDDLPYNATLVEKLDPVSRYVNDDDI